MTKLCIRYMCIAVLMLTASLTAHAQNANQILADAEKALFGQGNIMQALFASKVYIPSEKTPQALDGTMYIDQKRFRLQYGQTIATYTEPNLSIFDASEATFTISKPTEEELLQMNPLLFLSSRAKAFNVAMAAKSNDGVSLRFTPKQNGKIKYFTVLFHNSTKLPKQVTAYWPDGSRIEITFQFKPVSKTIGTPAFFNINRKDFPKAEFIDMR